MLNNETKITVRYVETDKMGIVHHSNYYIYFEEARTQFIKMSGMTYSEMEENGIMLPLVESNCRYKLAAKYEDELIINTWISELTPAKVKFNYSVFREKDQKELAKGSTLHAFVNQNFRIVNLKKTNPGIFEKLHALIL